MPDLNKIIDLSEKNEFIPETEDQDETQLEIDISSASFTKKRQLVTINDNLCIQSIQKNELGWPFFEESQ